MLSFVLSFLNSDCLVTERRQDVHVNRMSKVTALTENASDLTRVVDFVDDHFVSSPS